MNSETDHPWLGLDDDTEFLCGNKEGFRLLATAIDQLLGGDESSVSLNNPNLCLPGVRLQDAESPSSPTNDTFIRVIGWSFVLLLVFILLLAAFGLTQLINLISNF
jgi:hypothetical protein